MGAGYPLLEPDSCTIPLGSLSPWPRSVFLEPWEAIQLSGVNTHTFQIFSLCSLPLLFLPRGRGDTHINSESLLSCHLPLYQQSHHRMIVLALDQILVRDCLTWFSHSPDEGMEV